MNCIIIRLVSYCGEHTDRSQHKRYDVLPGQRAFLFFFLVVFTAAFGSVYGQDSNMVAGREGQIVNRLWDILQKSPRRGTTFDRVYRFYVDSGHTSLLLERCREQIETQSSGPDGARAELLLGLVLERCGESDSAAVAFEKALQMNPQDATAALYLGEIRFHQGKWDDALVAFEEALRRKPHRIDLRNVLHQTLAVVDRLDDRKKFDAILSRLEQSFPDDIELWQQIAETLLAEGRLDRALILYRRLIESSLNDPYARTRFILTAAEIDSRLGNRKQALEQYDRLLDDLASDSWPAETVRNRIEQFFTQKDDFPGLAEFYRKRLEKHPGELESVCQLARYLQQMGRIGEAQLLLEAKIKSYPSNIALRETLIPILVANDSPTEQIAEKSNVAKALEQYAELDRLAPGDVDRISRWGRLALANPAWDENRRKREALTVWQRLLKANPNDPQALVRLADLAAQYELADEAELNYRRAVELRPTENAYREALGMFYHREQRKEEAVETLRSMAQGPLQNTENLLYSGTLMQSLGYFDAALRQFEIAVRSASDDPLARWQYTEALMIAGETEPAFKEIIETQNYIDSDEQFDAFLHREVRFLQNLQGKSAARFDRLVELLEQKLGEGDLTLSKRQQVRLFWRLAEYHLARGKIDAAVQAIQQALATDEPSQRLMQAAAEIFERCNQKTAAIELYRQLLDIDDVWRINYLKRLTTLLFELGETEQAVETGRRLMDLGSGSATNLRFFADLLIKLDHRDEATGILRQALRIEPGDISTLKLLAKNLAATGQNREAAEIAWRLFERQDNAAARLETVEMLIEFFKAADDFNLLLRRLREGMQHRPTRRHFALALAAVYFAESEFTEARSVLENELTDMQNSVQNSTPGLGADPTDLLLFRQLVDVAERQGDLSSAVRYQEIVFRLHRTFETMDRLFILYDKNGDAKKAVDLFMSGILLKPQLADQLDSIDRMIGREEYVAVDRVLSFLEIHGTPNWQVPYRRIALACYLKEGDVWELAWEFRSLFFSSEPLALSNENQQQAAQQAELRNGAWTLSGLSSDWTENAGVSTNEEFMLTLFRERLERNEAFQTPNQIPPQKPFLVPRSFEEAKLFSLGWMLKEALDLDKRGNGTETNCFEESIRHIRRCLDDDKEKQCFENLLRWIEKVAKKQ